MDSLAAFAMGRANRDKELMVFDWDAAARLIKEHNATSSSAGLHGDWEWTGGEIFTNGKPTDEDDTYTFLASTWAKPELEVRGITYECYRMQSETPGWDSSTFWPESALAILRGDAD